MDRPSKPSLECPSCHWTSFLTRCDKGKQRILANAEGLYYKEVPCVLWEPKREPVKEILSEPNEPPAVDMVVICPRCKLNFKPFQKEGSHGGGEAGEKRVRIGKQPTGEQLRRGKELSDTASAIGVSGAGASTVRGDRLLSGVQEIYKKHDE